MANNEIRLICFDLGGVLIRITHNWRDTLLRAGITDPLTVVKPEVVDLYRGFEIGQIAQDDFVGQLKFLTGWSAQQTHAVLSAVLQDPYPGIDALLDALHNRNVQTACLSNTNAFHWAMMLDPGPTRLPLDRLHFRFASHLIGAAKPDPTIYQHVEQATGCPPASIVFFDDMPANVVSARQRGWQAYPIDPHADPVAQIIELLESPATLSLRLSPS